VRFLLDTSVAIHLRDRHLLIAERVSALRGDLFISVITRVELEGGVVSRPDLRPTRRQRLDAVLPTLTTVAFDEASVDCYRQIVEAVGFSRPRILDRTIAAQALAHDATLVTMNGQDFRDIPQLNVLAW
jgi:tRNA(fMet)-specific endonuclease VapC